MTGMDWNHAAAAMIDGLGAPDLPELLARGLRSLVAYDYTVVFGYRGTVTPLHLFDDFPPDRRRLHVEEYLVGPYLLDPFFLASRDLSEPGLYRLAQIAPDRFYQGEYFRNYYAQTGLAEEVGFLIRVHRRLVLVISLMRRQKRFSAAEIRRLETVRPVIDAVARRHWCDVVDDRVNDGAGPTPGIEGRIEVAFRRIGAGVLSPRERQVVELTLRGHSAEAIGRLLGIASGTVRIHRRNIYSKLRINSQGELFSCFINAMIDERKVAVSELPSPAARARHGG